jgi:hypothetical protein
MFSRLQRDGSPGDEALSLNTEQQLLPVQPPQDAGLQNLPDGEMGQRPCALLNLESVL